MDVGRARRRAVQGTRRIPEAVAAEGCRQSRRAVGPGLCQDDGLKVRLAGSRNSVWRLPRGRHVFRGIPGDIVTNMMGVTAANNDEIRAKVLRELGLDRPLLEQYVWWLVGCRSC